MSTYFVFFFFLVCIGLLQFYVRDFQRYYQAIFAFIFVLMLVAASLRDTSVGVDGEVYKLLFGRVPPITQWLDSNIDFPFGINAVEPSFIIFSGVSKLFSNHVSGLFFIYAIIAVGSHFYSFHKYILEGSFSSKTNKISGLLFLAIILYYMNAYVIRDLGVMRLGAACAVSLLTIEPVHKRKHFRFFIIAGIAIFLHTTALVLFVPWILSFTRLIESRSAMLITLVLSILIGQIGISNYIISSLPPWLGYLTDKTTGYANSKYATEIGLLSLVNLKNIAMFSIFLCLQKNLEKKNKFFNTLMLFLISGIYLRFIFTDFGILGGRFGSLLTSVDVILLPLILLSFQTKSRLFVWSLLFIFAIAGLNANLTLRRNSGDYTFSDFSGEVLNQGKYVTFSSVAESWDAFAQFGRDF